MVEKIYKKLARILASDKLFWAVLAFFVFEAIWIAVSNKFPALYDEAYHFGVIRLHSQQWLPYFRHQPAGADIYGAIYKEPSYLYHYTLSIPYRVLVHFVHNVEHQIIFLRLINVCMFTAGLAVFRKALLLTKSSKALINTVFIFIALTPIAPFLASQINYDNLLILGMATTMLLSLKLNNKIKKEGKVDFLLFSWLLILCLVTSLVMSAFLPVFVAVIFYFSWEVSKLYRGGKLSLQELHIDHKKGLSFQKLLVLALLLISTVLFLESYGTNIIKYHNPVAPCEKALSVQACMKNRNWYRDYIVSKRPSSVHTEPTSEKILDFSTYSGFWIHQTLGDVSHAGVKQIYIPGVGTTPGSSPGTTIPLPWLAINLVAVAGVILIIRFYDKITADNNMRFLLIVSFAYLAVLLLQNYRANLTVGAPEGVQGRYLVILFPILFLAAAQGFSIALRKHMYIRLAAFLFILICMLDGGGTANYILRTNQTVYWDKPKIIRANLDAQKALSPVIIKNQ